MRNANECRKRRKIRNNRRRCRRHTHNYNFTSKWTNPNKKLAAVRIVCICLYLQAAKTEFQHQHPAATIKQRVRLIQMCTTEIYTYATFQKFGSRLLFLVVLISYVYGRYAFSTVCLILAIRRSCF